MLVKNKNRIGLGKARLSRAIFIITCTIIPIISFAVQYLYVHADAFLMAFQVRGRDNVVWSFDNFVRFFNELSNPTADLTIGLINTFKSFLLRLIMFIIGFFVSYFLYKKILFYNIFRVVFLLPGIVSSVVIANIYREIVSSEPFERFIQWLYGLDYLPEPLAQVEFANTFVFIHMFWLGFPGNLILLGGTFARIPDSVIEYAKLDGVNWVQEMFKIIIPLVWPTFSLLLILTFASVFNSGGAVFLLTSGGLGTQTFANWMYMQVYTTGSQKSNVYNYMSAVGMCITVVACTLSLATRWMSKKFFSDVTY